MSTWTPSVVSFVSLVQVSGWVDWEGRLISRVPRGRAIVFEKVSLVFGVWWWVVGVRGGVLLRVCGLG